MTRTFFPLFAAGLCPICGVEPLALIDRAKGSIVFWCPGCGLVWNSPPSGNEVNSFDGLEQTSPLGVTLPDRGEVAGIQGVFELPAGAWEEELAVLVQRGLLLPG